MSDKIIFTTHNFKLRAGSTMPTTTEDFAYHTFMAEKWQEDSIMYETDLPASTDFRGRGGTYTGASFQRLPDKSGKIFSGQITHNIEYVDEDDI